jgi:hypothetical protein
VLQYEPLRIGKALAKLVNFLTLHRQQQRRAFVQGRLRHVLGNSPDSRVVTHGSPPLLAGSH